MSHYNYYTPRMSSPPHKINIVYYVWVNPARNWEIIVDGQLSDLIQCGILEISKLYIVACCTDHSLLDYVQRFIHSKIPANTTYNLAVVSSGNFFEFPGIKCLYSLAMEEPDKYYLYLHTKGMFHWMYSMRNNTPEERCSNEVFLTRGHAHPYKRVVELFDADPAISRICMFPDSSEKRMCYYNFYWARGSYLATCQDPIISHDRFYYEHWSGTGNPTVDKVYNLMENNYNAYTGDEANALINRLQ